MTPTTGAPASESPREWDSTASRIEELELRLELERGRVQIRDLKALLAVYQHDNDRLRSILNHTFRERAPAEAYVQVSDGRGVDASVGPPLPSARISHAHTHALAQPPSAASALMRSAWDRAVKDSSWLKDQQQQAGEEGGVRREEHQMAVGSGGWKGLRSSCDFCTGSKIRCDGGKPTCGNCQQRGRGCRYSAKRRPGPKPSRGASDDLSQAPPTQRPRVISYDRLDPHSTRTHLPQPSIGRFYATHTHSPPRPPTQANTHRLSPVATHAATGGARDGDWRASFDDAQVMSPHLSPHDVNKRRAAF